MNVENRRRQLAAQLTAGLDGVTVHAYRPVAVKAGDGWLILTQVQPSTFGTCTATFDVAVCLAADEQGAEQGFDRQAVALIDVIGAQIGTAVTVTPQRFTIGSATVFACVATLLCEVK